MIVTVRIEDEDQLEFLSRIKTGKRSEKLREGLKLLMYNLDKSSIARDINVHQKELDRLESLFEWKLELDEKKDNLVDQLMDNPRLVQWLGWYHDKVIEDIVKADEWFDMVIKNIQQDVGLMITRDNFMTVYQRKINKNSSLKQFAEGATDAK